MCTKYFPKQFACVFHLGGIETEINERRNEGPKWAFPSDFNVGELRAPPGCLQLLGPSTHLVHTARDLLRK